MSARHDVAGDAYFENDRPRNIPWARVASMVRDPSGWEPEGVAAMADLVRLHRAYEVCRLGFVFSGECWSTDPRLKADTRREERRALRDAERALRAVLA